MKKILKFLLIIILNISIMITFCGCQNSKNNENGLKEKLNSEIAYLDSELINMINLLNNISFDKYKVEAKEIDDTSKGKEDKQSENNSGQEESEQNSSKEKENEKNNEEKQEYFSMFANNIIGDDKQINWNELKNKIETIYSSWPIISSDLNELNISNELLNQFEKNMDLVVISIKGEDKNSTIENLVELYKFLPDFQKQNEEETKYKILECKYNLLLCYKYANLQDWDRLNENVGNLKMSFSNINGGKDEFKEKEVNIRNCKMIINGMSDISVIKDNSVFFIKYKNLMEEFNILLI